MVDGFNELLSGLDHPSMRHAIFGHLPIAMCILLVPLTVAAALLSNNRTCRIFSLCGFALLLVTSYLTVVSGERAEAAIEKVLSREAYDLIHEHEEMATKLWYFAIAGLLLVAGADRIARRALRRIALWLAVFVSIAASGWVSLTSHHGGTLVYIHGVGTPNPVPCNEDEHAGGSSDEAADSSATDQRIALFKHTVFPIISENCFQCHNPTKVANRKSGRLDLTSREALLKGGVNGPGVIEFKPEDSLLIQRIKHPDLEEVMPPEDPLSAEQIAAIEQWIRDGAIWR